MVGGAGENVGLRAGRVGDGMDDAGVASQSCDRFCRERHVDVVDTSTLVTVRLGYPRASANASASLEDSRCMC